METDLNESLRGRKIAFVFGSLDLGGAERRGLLLADYLMKHSGADVHVFGLSEFPGRLSDLCNQLGVRWSGISFHWGIRRRLPSFLRAVNTLKKAEPDIIISYTRVPNLVSAWGWKWIGAKLCVWNQADEGLLLNGMPLYRLAISRAHCFISNSRGGRDFLVSTYGKSPKSVHLIHNGVALSAPMSNKSDWRKQWGIGTDRPVACMVANLSRYKDHETLIRAWGRVISESKPETLPLLILAGRFDGTEVGLTRLTLELGVGDHVRLIGQVEDIAGLLGAVDLFVYSSRSEGLPNGVLEAMSAGLPIVGTDIPGIRDAVGPDGWKYLSAAGDSNDMSERILLLLQDRELREGLGQALQMRADKEFTLEKMCIDSAELISASLAEREMSLKHG